jgi:heptosyltransferase II
MKFLMDRDCFGILIFSYLRPKKTIEKNNIKKILLINLQGIGDLVMTTPFLNAIRKEYPKAQIHYLTYKRNGTIFFEDKRIDKLLVWSSGIGNLLKTLSFIRSEKYDLAINLFRAQHSAYLTLLSNATYKLGFLYSLKLSSNNLKLPKSNFPKTRNQRLAYSFIAQMLGFTIKQTDDLNLKTDSKNASTLVDKLLTKNKINKTDKLIGINCNATWPSKNWSQENWITLTRKLLTKYKKAKLVFIGGQNDKSNVDEVLNSVLNSEQESNTRLINLVGKCNLSELPYLVNKFSLFITTDSGPMHVAFATKTKTIALFAVTNPKLLISEKPWFKIISVYDKVPYFYKFNFNNAPLCDQEYMDKINVDEVLNQTNNLLY